MGVRHDVKIRFNTNYREDDPATKEWRVIIDGQENFCGHVIINCPAHTSKDHIEGVGQKWHISCNASNIRFLKEEDQAFPVNYFREIIIS